MSTTIEMVSLRPNPQRIIEKSTKLKWSVNDQQMRNCKVEMIKWESNWGLK